MYKVLFALFSLTVLAFAQQEVQQAASLHKLSQQDAEQVAPSQRKSQDATPEANQRGEPDFQDGAFDGCRVWPAQIQL